MTGRMTQKGAFLKDILKEANQKKRQQILRFANVDQINAVSDLSWQKNRAQIKTLQQTASPDCKSSSEYKKKTQTHDPSIRSRCLE